MNPTQDQRYDWALPIHNAEDFAAVVRLIQEKEWHCTPVLKEEDGYGNPFKYSHVYFNTETYCLYAGLFDSENQITLNEMPTYMARALSF